MNARALAGDVAARVWYGGHRAGAWLAPLAAIYRLGFVVARALRRRSPPALAVPVIVVGNLTLGGSGKTPLVIYLARLLKDKGYRIGIVSRGYRARLRRFPHRVRSGDDALSVGDEPRLIADQTGCPIVIAPRRREAAQYLIEHCGVELILSDDGLQHYALPRSLEIVVVDGGRKFGNGRLLPAGPLREPLSRLETVDYVVVNGGGTAPVAGVAGVARVAELRRMALRPSRLRHLLSGREETCDYFRGERVHACAGIGNPDRFFELLDALGMELQRHVFPDHHAYRQSDLCFGDDLAVVMTAKDGVQCQAAARSDAAAWRRTLRDAWIVDTEVQLDADFEEQLLNRVEVLLNG